MARKILITGAAGFIGQIVAKALLDEGDNELILADVIEPRIPKGGGTASKCQVGEGRPRELIRQCRFGRP